MYTSWLDSAVPHCCTALYSCCIILEVSCRPSRCARAKRRRAILLSSGWQPLEDAHAALEPPLRRRILLHAQPVPHQLLLPRVSLLVHPGGSGSVAAALLAGVPQLTFPLHFDQVMHVSSGGARLGACCCRLSSFKPVLPACLHHVMLLGLPLSAVNVLGRAPPGLQGAAVAAYTQAGLTPACLLPCRRNASHT